jgi:hypothetical protein
MYNEIQAEKPGPAKRTLESVGGKEYRFKLPLRRQWGPVQKCITIVGFLGFVALLWFTQWLTSYSGSSFAPTDGASLLKLKLSFLEPYVKVAYLVYSIASVGWLACCTDWNDWTNWTSWWRETRR